MMLHRHFEAMKKERKEAPRETPKASKEEKPAAKPRRERKK